MIALISFDLALISKDWKILSPPCLYYLCCILLKIKLLEILKYVLPPERIF